MNAIYRFLFPAQAESAKMSVLLLTARILFGALLISHGLPKFTNFESLSAVFPDPLGVGSSLSLGLAVFAELLCPLAFIFGFLYRLALLPMIFTMGMAFFVIHGADPFAAKELAFMYLAVYVLMYAAGPGKFSLDNLISKKF